MDTRFLTNQLSVSGQIAAEDVAALAAAGFRTIIANRPDGESPGQPPFADIARAAEQANIAARHIPVVMNRIGAADIAAFRRALDAAPGPVFAYCRSGARAAALWALAEAPTRPLPDILAATAAAGYDMTSLAPRLLAETAQ